MYSGTDGVEMTADIFFGIVHYQRLRHMVSDKFQVRNQGPIDQVKFLRNLIHTYVWVFEIDVLLLLFRCVLQIGPENLLL